MIEVRGPSLDTLDDFGDQFGDIIVDELRSLAETLGGWLGDVPTVDDLAGLHSEWERRIEDRLVFALRLLWHLGAAEARQVVRKEVGLVAAGERWTDVVPPSLDLANVYLGNRRNFLVGVGDDYWDMAREELLVGMQGGEGVPELAARLVAAVALAEPRARTVARTEVVGASNAGSIAQVRALGMDGTKEWVATEDARTRPHHRAADGQRVPLDQPFHVGGHFLDRPHAEGGPASEVANCRCTVSFDVDDEGIRAESGMVTIGLEADRTFIEHMYDHRLVHSLELAVHSIIEGEVIEPPAAAQGYPVLGITAAGDPTDGAMIALVPSDDDLDRLALDGGLDRDQLHLTLWYLGRNTDIDPARADSIVTAVSTMIEARGYGPVPAHLFAPSYFNPGPEGCWVLLAGDLPETEELAIVREAMMEALDDADFAPPTETHTPWHPHVSISYVVNDTIDYDDPAFFEDLVRRLGPVTFDKVRLAFGTDVTDIPLRTSQPGEHRIATGARLPPNGADVARTLEALAHALAQGRASRKLPSG